MIYISGLISLIIQGVVGIIDFLALKIESKDELLKDLLKVELVVQIIEFMFYISLVFYFKKAAKNITPFRYIDWAITTPLMLITLSAFLNYDDTKPTRLRDFLSEHADTVVTIVVLNASMLLFGLAGELGFLNPYTSTALGFIPFALNFKLIKDTFLHSDDITKNLLFYWFVVVWGMYGVFAVTSYTIKNTGYNILDIFSKNFFGVFLAYTIWSRASVVLK
jgi:bacteriorhodopsin